jgi:hypothetical protein
MGMADLSTKVAAQAGGAALASQGVPGAASVVEHLLRELLQVQDEQAEAIARIDASVQRLVDGPWETAKGYIEEAAWPNLTTSERRKKLRHASVELHRAVPLQPDATFQRAYACFDLALIERVLGDKGSSVLYARQGLRAATTYVSAETALLKKREEAKLWRSNGLFFSVFGGIFPGLSTVVGSAVTEFRLRSHGRGFPNVWREFITMEKSAVALCGDHDPEIQKCHHVVAAELSMPALDQLPTATRAIAAVKNEARARFEGGVDEAGRPHP